MINNPVDLHREWYFIAISVGIALSSFVLVWMSARYWTQPQDRGVAVQGAFRSNLGIIGLALCESAFGSSGLAIGAVLLAVVTPVFNVLSIWGLNQALHQNTQGVIKRALIDTARNPLIIAIICGFFATGFDFKPPKVMYDSLSYLANLTLPLALLVIGASISLKEFKQTTQLSCWVVLLKLVFVPLFAILIAKGLGITGTQLGCLVIMFASPTATASFVMVRTIGGNYSLASNIIVLSTVMALLTISLWLYCLTMLAWF